MIANPLVAEHQQRTAQTNCRDLFPGCGAFQLSAFNVLDHDVSCLYCRCDNGVVVLSTDPGQEGHIWRNDKTKGHLLIREFMQIILSPQPPFRYRLGEAEYSSIAKAVARAFPDWAYFKNQVHTPSQKAATRRSTLAQTKFSSTRYSALTPTKIAQYEKYFNPEHPKYGQRGVVRILLGIALAVLLTVVSDNYLIRHNLNAPGFHLPVVLANLNVPAIAFVGPQVANQTKILIHP